MILLSKTFKQSWLAITLPFILATMSYAQEDIFKKHLVYQEQAMNAIKSIKIAYRDTLDADVYVPVRKATDDAFPCVIFVSSFPSLNFRYVQAYVDWAKLMAANGIIGVVYETNSPISDFDKLSEYLTANAKTIRVDTSRIGIWSASGNSLLALNKVNGSNRFKCHSIYYGLTTTISSQFVNEVQEMSNKNGFAFFVESEYTSKVPTLIVRAGKDSWTTIVDTIDEFVRLLLTRNIPFQFINYPEGQHAFDVLDDSDTSKRIIVETVEFFKRELERSQSK